MHVFLLVDTVEYGARNVADAFGNNPPDCGGGYGVYQSLKATSTDNPMPTKQMVSRLL